MKDGRKAVFPFSEPKSEPTAMRKTGLYVRLCWLFFISLFVPTATITPKIDALLADLKGEQPPGDQPPAAEPPR